MAAYYLNAIAMQQRQEPGNAGRPDIKYFPPAAHILSELYYLLLIDSSLDCIEKLQEDYYKSFSFDRITKLNTIDRLSEDMSSMGEQLDILRRKIASQEADLAHKDEELKVKRRDENEIIHDRLQILQRDYQLLKSENDELTRKLDILEEYTRILESSEDADESTAALKTDAIDMGRLMTERFIFVGGTPDIISKLRATFTSSLFADNENQQINLSGVTYMVMFVKNMSHALYYKYIEAARSIAMPVIYCNMRNYDMVIAKICSSIAGGESDADI